MAECKYHPPVDGLLNYGDPREMGEEWPDYLQKGFGRVHIPELLRVLNDGDLHMADGDSPEVWAPVHAWRILGQLHAVEAIEALLETIRRAGTDHDDWKFEEMPDVFGLIGPSALPGLTAYLGREEHDDSSRSCASECIAKIARTAPEHRQECIGIITEQLRLYNRNSADLNGLLICDLMNLYAGESIEVIRAAFRDKRVTVDIPGDLEDVEIEMGFREKRSTPQPRYNSLIAGQQKTTPALAEAARSTRSAVYRDKRHPISIDGEVASLGKPLLIVVLLNAIQ